MILSQDFVWLPIYMWLICVKYIFPQAKDDKLDNYTLRQENELFRCEIMAMKEKKKNNMCPQCDGPSIGEEERMCNLENLKTESQRMREEVNL